jgi:hypothetical protein
MKRKPHKILMKILDMFDEPNNDVLEKMLTGECDTCEHIEDGEICLQENKCIKENEPNEDV